MKHLCELEERHGVNLGEGYKNNHACATFVKYIAKDLQDTLKSRLKDVRFIGLQSDGTIDKATTEQELFTVQYFDPKDDDSIIHERNQYGVLLVYGSSIRACS